MGSKWRLTILTNESCPSQLGYGEGSSLFFGTREHSHFSLSVCYLIIYLILFILKHISARSESTGWYQKYDISQSQTCQLLSWSLRYYNHVYHVHSEITIDLVTWDAIYEHSKLISASASASPFLLYPWPIYSLTFIRNPLKIVPRKMLYR